MSLTNMSAWMSVLGDHLRLRDVTMPGSHDAGVYSEVSSGKGLGRIAPKSFSSCQDRSVLEQCEAGSRFFDIRLKVSEKSIRAHHTTAGQGAVGESWDSTLESVSAFLDANRSEVVILRLTKPKGAKEEIVQKLLKSSLKGDRLFTSPVFENIADLPLRPLRGKAICVFDPKPFKTLHPTLGMHPFFRYEDGGQAIGLVTCGKYSDASKISKVIDGQVAKMDAHAGHRGGHLFVLYWTQTNFLGIGNIEGNTKARPNEKLRQQGRVSGGAHHNMDYLKGLLAFGTDIKTGSAKVAVSDDTGRRNVMPNVIMYDFVNKDTSKEIVSLNAPGLRGHLVPH